MSGLDKVKNIVFKDERAAIDDLRGRSEDLERRAVDIAEALPHAIDLQTDDEQSREELLRALADPVGETMRESIRRDPESFADALFPVLGPTIRRAVSEAMRALAERLNRTVEHSFTRRGLQWRWESFRTGTPMSDLILRDTLLYRVEQIFVIARESGQLLSHVQDADVEATQDSDAVSAMLTAIQDFVRDSFGAYEQTDLNTVQVGGRTVWIFYGPSLMLAAVFFGSPNAGLRADFHGANEFLHRRYGGELVSGDAPSPEILRDVNSALLPLLTSDSAGVQSADNVTLARYGKFLIGAMVISLLWFVWAWYLNHEYHERLDSVVSALSAIPGVVVLDRSENGRPVQITILKDPSVTIPNEVFAERGLATDDFQLVAHAFQSSAPTVLLQKIRRFLKVPDSVSLDWNDGLTASGVCSQQWYEQFISLPFRWLGIEHLDYSGLEIIPNG